MGKDLLENCPWNDPSQDRERQGCSQDTEAEARQEVLLRPSGSRGWMEISGYRGVLVKRKVKAEAFHQKNVALSKAKAEILKDPKMVKTLAPYQAVIDSYGHK